MNKGTQQQFSYNHCNIDCNTRETNEDLTVEYHFDNKTSPHTFIASFDMMHNNNYYKTVTWVVSNSDKIIRLINTDVTTLNTDENGLFTVYNLCNDERNKSCVSSFLVNESAIEIDKGDKFDVSIYLSSYHGNLRCCKMKNVILKGWYCLIYNISYLFEPFFIF